MEWLNGGVKGTSPHCFDTEAKGKVQNAHAHKVRMLILAWKNHITHKKFLAFHVGLFSHSGEPASDSKRFHASSHQNVLAT